MKKKSGMLGKCLHTEIRRMHGKNLHSLCPQEFLSLKLLGLNFKPLDNQGEID